ncbi:MAG: ThiF family adenylyltransferase [Burkholderiales bacterium]
MFSYDEAFGRNLGWVTADEQQVLRRKRIAIGGLGGTGGNQLLTLCRLGVGAFNLADFDTFSLANFNRQAGATVSTLDQPKVDVLAAMARDINPELDLRLFPGGVTEGNVDEFFRDVDVYVDSLDYFAFDARHLVHRKCAQLGIPAVTVAPLGMGAAMVNFLPGGVTFEEYFGLQGVPEVEKALRFLVGLSPALLQRTYLADASRVKLGERAGPSTARACLLCAAVAATEALKLLLKRGKVYGAPWVVHFDAYRNRLAKSYRPGGYRNPLQRLAVAAAKRQLARRERAKA